VTPPSNLALQNHVIFSLSLAISIFTSTPTSKAPQAKPGSQPPGRPSRQYAFPVTTAASQGNEQDEKLEWCSSSRTYYSLFVSYGQKANSGPVIMFQSVSKTFPTCIPCSEAPGLTCTAKRSYYTHERRRWTNELSCILTFLRITRVIRLAKIPMQDRVMLQFFNVKNRYMICHSVVIELFI
jgi:hypothetical protein